MSHFTESYRESPEEMENRIVSMLKSMMLESVKHTIKHDKGLPIFSRTQIANYCGTSKDNISRIEKKALRRLERKLAQLY